jgi:hypothetical protein
MFWTAAAGCWATTIPSERILPMVSLSIGKRLGQIERTREVGSRRSVAGKSPTAHAR